LGLSRPVGDDRSHNLRENRPKPNPPKRSNSNSDKRESPTDVSPFHVAAASPLKDNASEPFSGCLNPEQAYSAGKTSGSLTYPEIIAAVGRTPVGQTQTGVPTNQSSSDRQTANTTAPPRVKGPSSGERPTPKRMEWSDLTPQQLALRNQMLREGIHPTPEMILKLTGGKIERHPVPSSLDGDFAGFEFVLKSPDGREYTAIEGNLVEIGLGRWKKENPHFLKLWRNKPFSLELNIPSGLLGIAVHGGVHIIARELHDHDEDDLLAWLIAHKYRDSPEPPHRPRYGKKLREKINAAHRIMRSLAYQNQVQTGTQQVPKSRKSMQEKNGGRLRERHGGKFSRTLTEARRLKRYVATARQRMAARGFTFPLAISGVLRNRETGRREYRRIELYKASEWTRREVAWLHRFFKRHIPRSRGAVFAFHNNKLYLDEKDPLLKFMKPVSQVEQRSDSYTEFMTRRHMPELASVGDIQ